MDVPMTEATPQTGRRATFAIRRRDGSRTPRSNVDQRDESWREQMSACAIRSDRRDSSR